MVEDRKLGHDEKLREMMMGWLRNHGALKVSAIRERFTGPFDDAPEIPHEMWEREQEEWRLWQQTVERSHQSLVAKALTELTTRNRRGEARPGRKPTLSAYKEYKSRFLGKWAAAVERNAQSRGALTQNSIAEALGFTDATEFRALKRCDEKRQGMLPSRFPSFVASMAKNGWHRHRNIVHVWMLNKLMSPSEFETWVATLAPQQENSDSIK